VGRLELAAETLPRAKLGVDQAKDRVVEATRKEKTADLLALASTDKARGNQLWRTDAWPLGKKPVVQAQAEHKKAASLRTEGSWPRTPERKRRSGHRLTPEFEKLSFYEDAETAIPVWIQSSKVIDGELSERIICSLGA